MGSTIRKIVWWIAIVDLVLTSLSILAFLLLVPVTITSEGDSDYDGSPKISSESSRMVWTVLAVAAFITIIQLVAATKLLNASQEGKNPVEAVRLCNFWCGVTIACLFLTAMHLLRQHDDQVQLGLGLGSIALRILAIFCVRRFKMELMEGVGILGSSSQESY